MRGIRGAWAVVAALACGCAMVLGVDPEEYSLVCEPGAGRCTGNTPQSCRGDGLWQSGMECVGQTCVEGACKGVCESGAAQCTGNTPQSCDGDGQWQSGISCSAQSQVCISGACVVQPSCAGLTTTCGPDHESCCAMTIVPGGMYNRSNDPMFPTTVSEFRLDRFVITVGRYRAFVAAYPGARPAPGAGAHPLISGSGWNSAWNQHLPVDQAALIAAAKCDPMYQTWTDVPGANENLPMNCINWYEAFAFCAWDGGRLPTEAEWNYAAAGGNEQREYPWSNPPSSMVIDASYAVYDCLGDGMPGCVFPDILAVGSKSPAGDGVWGQADLSGGMWQWTLDSYGPYEASCNNCANMNMIDSSAGVVRGGSWYDVPSYLLSSSRIDLGRWSRDYTSGARCARAPY